MGSAGRSNAELKTQVHRQQIVAELGSLALETKDLDFLFQTASSRVAATLDNEYCKVLELLPGGDEVLLREGVGWKDGLVGSATVPTDLDSQAGYTLLTEEPVIVDDLRTEPRFSGPDLLVDHDVVSGVSVIIGAVDNPWGVLGTHSTEHRDFDEHDAAFLQSLANILASAVERVERETELGRTLDLFRQTEWVADVGGWEIDAETMEVFWSDHLYRIRGISDDLAPDLERALEMYHESDRHLVAEAIEASLEHAEPLDVEARIERDDGEIRWLHVKGVPEIEDGAVSGLRGAAQDITDRKERERRLAQYRAFTEAANDVIVTIDEESTIHTINDAVTDIFGYDPSDLEGNSLTTLMPDELGENHRDAITRYVDTGERTLDWEYLEVRGEHADGSTIPLGISFSEVIVFGTRYFTGVIRDISERKEYERELEESHKRLEHFASAVAHDLKEPLGTVTSYLQLLEHRYGKDLDEDAEEYIDYAVGGTERMRELLHGLLTTYARVDSATTSFEIVSLDNVFENVVDDLQRRIEDAEATITRESLPETECDAVQIHQLFMNLLDNAIKYSGNGAPRIDVTATEHADSWRISISDEGIGIDPDEYEAIFEEFYRLKDDEDYPGTGIGLALCRRIVERHDGEIWVESEPGEGSTFTVALPKTQG